MFNSYTYMSLFRSDEAYHARVQLAAIDYNMHRDRPTCEGEHGARYHRVFRKRTKHWDAVPTKMEKQFLYIPELISQIFT